MIWKLGDGGGGAAGRGEKDCIEESSYSSAPWSRFVMDSIDSFGEIGLDSSGSGSGPGTNSGDASRTKVRFGPGVTEDGAPRLPRDGPALASLADGGPYGQLGSFRSETPSATLSYGHEARPRDLPLLLILAAQCRVSDLPSQPDFKLSLTQLSQSELRRGNQSIRVNS